MRSVVVVWLVVVMAVAIGWIKNIIAIVDFGFDAGVTIEIALRIVGIFVVPLGVIMGYFI